ncbi:MAG: molecular chaperone DnaJ [Alphaproteobacteria bacterium CG_4_9_14_3_um_filter_47_13]|nr:MAG: molecular chaperone DnaJ [Alphaproteobacteria bacterium CG_4_9_14_3_um_filter_47_13]
MPYLLLAIGIFFGIYGLYRFFLSANVKQVWALLLTGSFLAISTALFFLALTGRLPAALALLVGLWPFGVALWQKKKKARPESPSSSTMTREEALEVLGLKENASKEDIKKAYKDLIKKNHPDQEGTQWLAARINQARDILLK